MRAAVINETGSPEVFRLEERPVPQPAPGQVLIEVKAFGLNRSEMFTRQGLSPGISLPRILGIEAAGIVAAVPGGEFEPGDVVLTAMGGMGRQFDGGYAEYVCVPANQVQRVAVDLPWEVLGALPEMLQTAWGSLFKALRLARGDTLLIRGGTTSVGQAAAAIARRHGATVFSTSRSSGRFDLLREAGADHPILEDGNVAEAVRRIRPAGVDKVLELVGTTTLEDSLRAAASGGVVCMTGIVGNAWSLEQFSPMDVIPSTVCLTTYDGGVAEFMATPFDELAALVKQGQLRASVGRTFRLDEIVAAHRCMEENKAGGKIVVLP